MALFLFPSIRQFRSWSLVSKVTYISFVLGLVVLAWNIVVWFIAVPEYAVLACNYGNSEMTIYGDDGESPNTAVVIRNAKSHEAGVFAEHCWIARRFPGYRKTAQAIFEKQTGQQYPEKLMLRDVESGIEVEGVTPGPLPDRMFDVVIIRNWFGRTREVYFDISPFFGIGDEERTSGLTPSEATQENYRRLMEARKKAGQGSSGSMGTESKGFETIPRPLMPLEKFDENERPIAAAAKEFLPAGHEPADYVVEIICSDERCRIHLYRAALLSGEYQGWRGCPIPICATLTYSRDASKITGAVHWQ